MGLCYTLECQECGYKIEVEYGAGRNAEFESIQLKKKFDEGCEEPQLQRVYNALKESISEEEKELNADINDGRTIGSPWVEKCKCLYECGNCHRFFTHDRIHMTCDLGEFTEKYTVCPFCGKEDCYPIEEEELRASMVTEHFSCPECGRTLKLDFQIIRD